ncbi:MAG: cytochrome c3 family protein [Bilophila sp.]
MKNGRKLLRWIALAAIAVIGLGWLLSDSPLQAGEIRPDVIRIDAIGQLKSKLEMPAAVFLHDKHTTALLALGKDCSVCHTATKDGHVVSFLRHKDNKNPEKLEDLYHEGCIGCHADMARKDLDSGPLDGQCRFCHATNVPTSAEAPLSLGDKSLHYLHVSSKAITSPGNEENCGACHHVFDEKLKKLVWEKGKEDACAACHGLRADGNKPSLKTAVHTKCVWCHVAVADESRRVLTAEAHQGAVVALQGEKKHKDKSEHGTPSAAKQAAAIEAAIVTGPRTCAGCHTLAAQATFKKVQDVPRLMRGQPDATVLLPVSNPTTNTPATPPVTGDAKAGMNPVVFNHKAHEAATDSCRTCHHVRISACTECHTVGGIKEGNFVTLSQSMHDPDSNRSCVGCHQQQVLKKPECAGCHRTVQPMTPGSCASCHKDVQGLTTTQIADGSAFKLSKDELAAIATANLTAKPVPALSPADMPETVTIGSLSKEFEPSVMPHRKIYEALQKGIGTNGMAAAFHTSPTATCAACHHHSPKDSLASPPKCGSCHAVQADKLAVADNRPSLKAAYHQQCMACHDQMRIEKPAATDCAGCHAPRKL